MSSSKQVADNLTTSLFVFLGAGAIVCFQAGLLLVILPWVIPTVTIGFWKALIITLYINLAFK
jgi:uncharacterized membrane protein